MFQGLDTVVKVVFRTLKDIHLAIDHQRQREARRLADAMAQNVQRVDDIIETRQLADTTAQLALGENGSDEGRLEAMSAQRESQEAQEARIQLEYQRQMEWEELYETQVRAEIMRREVERMLEDDPSLSETLKMMPTMNAIMRGATGLL